MHVNRSSTSPHVDLPFVNLPSGYLPIPKIHLTFPWPNCIWSRGHYSTLVLPYCYVLFILPPMVLGKFVLDVVMGPVLFEDRSPGAKPSDGFWVYPVPGSASSCHNQLPWWASITMGVYQGKQLYNPWILPMFRIEVFNALQTRFGPSKYTSLKTTLRNTTPN